MSDAERTSVQPRGANDTWGLHVSDALGPLGLGQERVRLALVAEHGGDVDECANASSRRGGSVLDANDGGGVTGRPLLERFIEPERGHLGHVQSLGSDAEPTQLSLERRLVVRSHDELEPGYRMGELVSGGLERPRDPERRRNAHADGHYAGSSSVGAWSHLHGRETARQGRMRAGAMA